MELELVGIRDDLDGSWRGCGLIDGAKMLGYTSASGLLLLRVPVAIATNLVNNDPRSTQIQRHQVSTIQEFLAHSTCTWCRSKAVPSKCYLCQRRYPSSVIAIDFKSSQFLPQTNPSPPPCPVKELGIATDPFVD